MRSRAASLALAAVLIGAVAACGGPGRPGSGSATDRLSGDLNVFAAASLTEAFNSIGARFHRAHPALRVTFAFEGTPTLVTQIGQGAPADVLASADQPNMANALSMGLVIGTPAVFAHNRLEIVVGAGNPKHVRGLADLARSDLIFIAPAAAVPAGRYGAQALAAAGVRASPRSLETDVRSVVAKVSLGEADAGIVYQTDIRSGGGKVSGVGIPDAQNVVASYPVAVTTKAGNPQAAAAFVAYLLSAPGQSALTSFGFGPA